MSYIVKIYTPQELNHSSYIQTGLFELERDSFLKTKVTLSFAKRVGVIKVLNSSVETYHQPHPKTSFYQLIDTETGKKINFATDLYDASNSFSKYALDHCDYVFKRSYETKYVSLLPKEYQKKLFPLGWCFGVHSSIKNLNLKFYFALLHSNLMTDSKWDRFFLKRIFNSVSRQQRHWNFIKTTRKIENFEQKPTKSEKDYIVFQTRCFAHENSKEIQQLHRQRYRIIKLLQSRFPEQFKGGFIPSEVVFQNYKDAITNLKTDPQSYLQLVKSSLIGIYTQGIQDSPAWKMAEYLSQGKVVIAQKFKTELPISLEDKKHLLFFENENEIPELCHLVLNNASFVEQLAENGRKYYEENISPKQNIKRIIEFMINHSI